MRLTEPRISASAVVAIGFLGAFAMSMQAGRMASNAEQDALASTSMDQRMDQLRTLSWPEITGGSGITSTVWTARPSPMAGFTINQETITVSAFDLTGTQTLTATWVGTGSPSVSLSSGTALSSAKALKVVASISWAGRPSSTVRTQTVVSIISKGGLSKSVR
ncbi:MAG: hypothetical protein ABMA01_15320 [Chthoniobacteraceae bacterium]